MEGAERKEDAVCTSDNYVSPYLLRPRGSCAEIMCDRGVKTTRATRRDRGAASNRTDDANVAPRIPKDGPCREGEARR